MVRVDEAKDELLGRAVEEAAEEIGQEAAGRLLAGDQWSVAMRQPLLFMFHQAGRSMVCSRPSTVV